MKKHIYLHIGYVNYEILTLQKNLLELQDKLSEKSYLYPSVGLIGNAHHQIARFLRFGQVNESEKILSELYHEIDNSSSTSVIISSEEFTYLLKDKVQKLSKAFQKYDVTIIIYLQPQDILLQFLWSSAIINGQQTDDFEAWLAKYVFSKKFLSKSSIHELPPLDYFTLIDRWSEYFDLDNVKFIINNGHSQNLLKEFLSYCDMQNSDWLASETFKVVEPSIKTIEIMRLVTTQLLNDFDKSNPLFNKLTSQLFATSTDLGWNNIPVNMITSELHIEIMDIFNQQNNNVAKQFLEKDSLFDTPNTTHEVTTFNTEKMNASEFIEFISPTLALNLAQPVTFNRRRGTISRMLDRAPKVRKLLQLILNLLRRR